MTPDMLADYRSGVPLKVMARRYDLSVSHIKNMRIWSGEPARRSAISRARGNALRRLWDAGAPHSAIAMHLNMTIGGVKAMRFRLGLPPRQCGRRAG